MLTCILTHIAVSLPHPAAAPPRVSTLKISREDDALSARARMCHRRVVITSAAPLTPVTYTPQRTALSAGHAGCRVRDEYCEAVPGCSPCSRYSRHYFPAPLTARHHPHKAPAQSVRPAAQLRPRQCAATGAPGQGSAALRAPGCSPPVPMLSVSALWLDGPCS